RHQPMIRLSYLLRAQNAVSYAHALCCAYVWTCAGGKRPERAEHRAEYSRDQLLLLSWRGPDVRTRSSPAGVDPQRRQARTGAGTRKTVGKSAVWSRHA